jgi:hypothetical protein
MSMTTIPYDKTTFSFVRNLLNFAFDVHSLTKPHLKEIKIIIGERTFS